MFGINLRAEGVGDALKMTMREGEKTNKACSGQTLQIGRREFSKEQGEEVGKEVDFIEEVDLL